MPALLLRHLFESTLFCLLLVPLACCLQKGAAARHAVWLIAVLKFAIPSVLLTPTGAKIAFFWPAGSWFSFVVAKVSALLVVLFGFLPIAASHSVLAVWAMGTVAMFGAWFVRLRSSKPVLTTATEEEHKALVQASQLLRVKEPVQLQASPEASEPVLRGIRCPVVVIPKDLYNRLTATEFQAVLLHELAHARRRDNLTSALAHCLVCLFWFHPLLWFAERRLRLQCELACDELVIACGTAPQVYLSGILKVCQLHLFDPLPGISAMTGSAFKRRLQLISACQPGRTILYIPRLLTALAAVLLLMLPIAGGYCEQCVSNGGGTIPTEVQKR